MTNVTSKSINAALKSHVKMNPKTAASQVKYSCL